VISVSGLERRFRTVLAVHDLSLEVPAGQVYGLLGPNGAGKTTTVRMLAALIAPTAGTARIADLTLGPDNARIRALTGILTESPGLHERLSARQNLAYYGRLYGLQGGVLRAAVDRHLDLVGLTDVGDRRVGGFSKGMRQRVAIARALLHEPRVIYLDEPTSGLAQRLWVELAEPRRDTPDLVRELVGRGARIVAVTEDVASLEQVYLDLVGERADRDPEAAHAA
jgi:ABC-2 type transport system ATP-binding protein